MLLEVHKPLCFLASKTFDLHSGEGVLPILTSHPKPVIQDLPGHKVSDGFIGLNLWSLTHFPFTLPACNKQAAGAFVWGIVCPCFCPCFLPSAEVVLFSVDMDLANTALISSSCTFCKFQESLNIYRSHNNLPRNVSSRVQLLEGWLWWVLLKALSLPNCHVKFLDWYF